MNSRSLCRFALCAAAIWLFAPACASSSTVDPFAVADEDEARTSLLDEPSSRERPRQSRTQASDEASFEVALADSQPRRTIDADPGDWDLSDLRRFDTERHVVEGARHWDGPQDASFAVAVDSDESHVYFWIEVVDDVVISSSAARPLDAVVIWLRDPALEDLLRSLPEALRDNLQISAEMAIAITPDGEFERYDSYDELTPNSVFAAAARTDDGYRVEVALALEALPYVNSLPLEDLAFRIDILDTDDGSSNNPQTHLTMLPRSRGDAPRFAVFDTGGLRPVLAPRNAAPRFDALGIWQQGSGGWEFETLEYISPRWRVLEDLQHVASEVVDQERLPEICTGSDQAMWLVEVYESSNRRQRVALVLCGTDAPRGQCRSGSETQLVWAGMRAESQDSWIIDRAFTVFDAPLSQCPFEAPSGQVFYHGFSMLPLDVVGPTVWGIGWHMRTEQRREIEESAGIFFVDPRSANFIVGDTPLRRLRVQANSRTINTSRVYLTDISEDGNMDICELALIDEQRCSSFNEDCVTREGGLESLTHIKTWDEPSNRFLDFMLHRHRNCRGNLTFADMQGYKILLIENRLGLLPTLD